MAPCTSETTAKNSSPTISQRRLRKPIAKAAAAPGTHNQKLIYQFSILLKTAYIHMHFEKELLNYLWDNKKP